MAAVERFTRGVVLMLLLLRIIAGCRLQATEGCVENERRALLAIKSDMYDPGGWFSSWTGDDCCKWRGVACNNATSGHVTKLDLRYPFTDDYGYHMDTMRASKVNPSLLELKHLKYLDLSLNNFDGANIPKMISSLVHLEYLNLSNAMFAGPIPPQLGNLSSLCFLDLDVHGLESDDLDWLTRIPSLKYLDMSYVYLSGATAWFHQLNSIPTLQVLRLTSAHLPSLPSPLPMFNLTSISVLDLSENYMFDDSLLTWLSNGSSLECLYLGGCSCFSNPNMETLRVGLAALSNLKELELAFSGIHGEISNILRNASRRLEHLDLGDNSLTGDIPQMIGNLTQLRHLDLSSNQISGEISPNMGHLVHLEFLCLSSNYVYGRIPWSMGNLTNLVYMYWSSNNISGGIPESFGNLYNLKELMLSNNNISGQLPQTIGNLHNLQSLELQNNLITGEIPKTLGKLYNLEKLDISNNQLRGKIPKMAGLCNLGILDLSHNNIGGELTDLLDGLSSHCPQGTQLLYLILNGNHLSGKIPSSLGHFSQLKILDLSSNSLQGDITEAHFAELVKLNILNISYNSLNVVLPNDWHPPFNASTIDMSSCHVRGKLPLWIQTQSHLQQLYLSGVGLSGNLPPWFLDFISEGVLKEVVLSSNNLSGPLPFTTTILMDLSNNSFVGPIPFSFLNLTKAIALYLSHNHISNSIPSSLCGLTSLRVLDLSRNHLSGEIPSCHGSSPTSLKSLHLNDNDLSGPLPSFLARCKDLVILDLGENKFYGEIPTWLGRNLSALKVLRLRSNILHGIIPVNLANLTSLQVLDLAFNKLHGIIPSSIGSLSSMTQIQSGTPFNILHAGFLSYYNSSNATKHEYMIYFYDSQFSMESITIVAKGLTEDYTTILSLVTSIDLSNNNLFGKIPEELTKLLGLRFLSLSNNHLTGSIPENIGVMTQLESLDLSMNNLTGMIPLNLTALNFLSHLNLSYNNLSGRIPEGNQLQTFNDPSVFEGNKDLCGFPLPECPSDALSPQVGDEESGDKLETILNCTFIVMGFVVGFWISTGTMILKPSIRVAVFRSVDKFSDWIYVQLAIKFGMQKPKT